LKSKKRITFPLFVAIFVLLTHIPASSATHTIKVGSQCPKINQVVNKNSKVFVCKVSEKKKVWKLRAVKAEKPKVIAPPKPTVLPRSNQDRPDQVSGYQIKFVYVVPKDGLDRQLDTNGVLTEIINQGNDFLEQEIGKRFQIDVWQNAYDIEFFRSELTQAQMSTANLLQLDLYREMKIADREFQNRKNYSFLIEINSLANGTACGYTNVSDFRNVVAVGPQCSGRSGQFADNRVTAWVHEALHNIGVSDTDGDGCEFVSHSACQAQVWRIDPKREFYVGASTRSGGDILKLRVWQDNANELEHEMFCHVESEALTAICSIGYAQIGPPRYQWSGVDSSQLFEVVSGALVLMGQGTNTKKPWGNSAAYFCGDGYTCPTFKLKQTTPGIKEYVWVINGIVGDRFKINWRN
jgi:hypothetical protein